MQIKGQKEEIRVFAGRGRAGERPAHEAGGDWGRRTRRRQEKQMERGMGLGPEEAEAAGSIRASCGE